MAYLLYGFQDALDWVEAYKSMEGSVFTRCLLAVSRHTTTRIGGYLNVFGQACSRTWDNSIFKSSHYDPYDSLCPNLLMDALLASMKMLSALSFCSSIPQSSQYNPNIAACKRSETDLENLRSYSSL